jgi:hypothetical protein
MRGVTGAARPALEPSTWCSRVLCSGEGVDRADQAVNAAGERTDGGGGRVEVRGAHRAVAQRHEVMGGVGGKLVAGVFEGSTEELVTPLAVLGDHQADRAPRVFELRDGVEEGAAAEGGLENPEVTSSPTARTRSRPCIVSACSVARAANVVVRTVQVGDDQVDLAGEVPVERRERDLALLDDPLDSHAVDALGVEQQRRGGQ